MKIAPPVDQTDEAYKRWSTTLGRKYGILGRAYVTLLECYEDLVK